MDKIKDVINIPRLMHRWIGVGAVHYHRRLGYFTERFKGKTQ
ncbi:hypothetical protein [Apibacter muscae]|nr:hypothetical protein [Apibacter muscae]